MKEILSTQEAARSLNVGPSTIKRWADQGLIRCIRTEGGHRRFLREELERMRQSQTHHSKRASQSYEEQWLDVLLDEGSNQAVAAKLLQDKADRSAWWEVADAFAPVLDEMGMRWQAGVVSVVEEHLATERLTRALAWLAQTIPVPDNAPVSLLVTAEGDDHTVGLCFAELVAREAGWDCLFSGRMTPVDEVRELIEHQNRRIDLVAVSASSSSDKAATLLEQHEALTSILEPLGTKLILGGSGAWPDNPPYGHRLHSFKEFHMLLTNAQ